MCVQNLDVDKYLNKSAVTSLYVCVLLHSCCAWDMEICSEVCLSVAGFTISDSECVCVCTHALPRPSVCAEPPHVPSLCSVAALSALTPSEQENAQTQMIRL